MFGHPHLRKPEARGKPGGCIEPRECPSRGEVVVVDRVRVKVSDGKKMMTSIKKAGVDTNGRRGR